MSTEDIGGPLTGAELTEITSSGHWTAHTPSPAALADFEHRLQVEEDYRVRNIMARPVIGRLHRFFKTSLYTRFQSLSKE